MILSFRTGYLQGDDLITDKSLIASRYLRGFFWVDLFSTVPFDKIAVLIWPDMNGSKVRIVKMIRLLRLGRLFKLMRILKFEKLREFIENHLPNWLISKGQLTIKST